MNSPWARLRANCAGILFDAPRYALALRTPRLGRALERSWETLHNRGERLSRDPLQRGLRCQWRWTSSLRYCALRPQVGLQLLQRALAEWPLGFAEVPPRIEDPSVTFVIGHRGLERVPLLLATIASIAAQEGPDIECVVVEQSPESVLAGLLPTWVRYVHTPLPRSDMAFSRSWAFNVGARVANGKWLVLQDNDILAPRAYAAEIVRVASLGFEGARLQRFVFYLDPEANDSVLARPRALPSRGRVEVVQNCEGHTIAITKDAYWRAGGHDEAFAGWGGEDNEFFDRLRGYRLHDHAYLPFVHLYHAPQPGKGARHSNSDYFDARMRLPAADRIAELSSHHSGQLSGPVSG